MGITGLINFMEKASRRVQMKDLRGSTVAVDTYVWLHKGAFACADKLARKEETDMHIQYCLKYVNMLLSHDIKPILVFDGRHLPAKAMTENKRRESRQAAKTRAAELLRAGKTEEAKSYLRRSVNITHSMALKLIQECRKRNVDCIVAPYEADAQLAYLNVKNIAQYVITEDSDLVLFGCTRIIFKLDLTGNGLLVEAEKLHLTMGCREDRYSLERFRYMCILSGCDYMDSLSGIGLAKACKFILKTEDTDIKRALAKMPSYLNMKQLVVSDEYKESFVRADATFKHMFVFDPIQRKLVRLNDPVVAGTDLKLCCNAGEFLEDKIAFQLALGNIDPFTMEQLDDWHPEDSTYRPGLGKSKSWGFQSMAKHPSIWQANFSTRQSDKVRRLEEKTTTKTIHMRTIDDEEDEESPSTEDMLSTYRKDESSDAPPRKKVCTESTELLYRTSSAPDIFDSPNKAKANIVENEAKTPANTVRRNPFAKSLRKVTSPARGHAHMDSDEGLQSPTKITEKNYSMVRNLSPVKRIPSVFSQKLSKFDRTAIDDKQKVVSRFFSTGNKTATITSEETESPEILSEEEVVLIMPILKTPPPKARLEEYAPMEDDDNDGDDEPEKRAEMVSVIRIMKEKYANQLLEEARVYLKSPEATLKERGDKTPKKQKPPSNNYADVREVKFGVSEVDSPEKVSSSPLSAKPDETTDNDVIDCDDYEEKPPTRLPVGKSTNLLRQQQFGNKCRVSGLMRNRKSAAGPKNIVNQSTLSMFGFQKRPQLIITDD